MSLPVRVGIAAGAGADTLETSCEECPRCETRRRRAAQSGGQPSVWYDTLIRDWVVRLPVIGPRLDGLLVRPPVDAILPLELWWFDVPWTDVYRAAADLAFAAEMFPAGEIEEEDEAA